MQGLTNEEYSNFLKTFSTVTPRSDAATRSISAQSRWPWKTAGAPWDKPQGLPPVAGTAGGLATGAASEVPADPNARMIAADQRGASADQASLQPCTAVETARGRPTIHGLLTEWPQDRRVMTIRSEP